MKKLEKSIRVFGFDGGHVQGIAVDKERKYIYFSFTTCLVKADLQGNVVASVTGLCGHLGCIAYRASDGRVYGSLEFKNDQIGRGILDRLGRKDTVQDGFYIAVFDVEKMDRLGMDAEGDGVMKTVFLPQVYADYSAPGHRYGCSGIDGVTFAPPPGETEPELLYVAYGIYGDTERQDNDHQVLLAYDTAGWDEVAAPLQQEAMHRNAAPRPPERYFVYTGNTTYGVQNLEYDPEHRRLLAAVYEGKKSAFPNYAMFFPDLSQKPQVGPLRGLSEEGALLPLTKDGEWDAPSGTGGSRFPLGSTGIACLGDGYFYFSEPLHEAGKFGSLVRLYFWNGKDFVLAE